MKTRLIIWLTACLASSIIFLGELWAILPQRLSPEGLERYGMFPWGVLGLCILWLFLKRKAIVPRMQAGRLSLPFVVVGMVLLALSIFLPRSDNFLVFLMLLGWLGIFTIIFSGAAIIPTILLNIYGFSLVFPIVTTQWLGEPSAILVTNTVIATTQMLGLPIMSQGQVLYFTSVTGDTISTTVIPSCAGYATIGIFIVLFTLAMLDIRLPLRKAWWIFLVGLVGTWLLNIIRIVISLAAGYYWGSGTLETVHLNLVYVIFPLWYALFAFIYLKQAGWRSKNRTA